MTIKKKKKWKKEKILKKILGVKTGTLVTKGIFFLFLTSLLPIKYWNLFKQFNEIILQE